MKLNTIFGDNAKLAGETLEKIIKTKVFDHL
jgi:hypothetical protein